MESTETAGHAFSPLSNGQAIRPWWILTPDRIHFLFLCVILYTSSFDKLLNFRIAGFSFRFCYLCILSMLFINLPRLKRYLLKQKEILGLIPLALWTLCLTGFVANTQFLARNVGYLIWHYIHIFFLVLLVNNVRGRDAFMRLFKAYVFSFLFVAVFGLVQFAGGIVGVNLLIEQWWFAGLPRINGFSYEPSYFGSYLLIGWIMLFLLAQTRTRLFPGKSALAMFATASAALFLSSSRMSIFVAVFFVGMYSLNLVWRVFLTLKARFFQIVFISMMVGMLGTGGGLTVKYWTYMEYFFSGLGIAGGSAHSSDYRKDTMRDTWNVFTRSPIVGVSLGGVASSIAEAEGIKVTSNQEARRHEGMNVFVEVLAASGAFGYLFFLAYFFSLFQKPFELMRALTARDPEMSLILKAMLLALAFELLILSMNQNILRPFLWFHIAMLSLAFKIGRNSQEPDSLPPNRPRENL
ncbi:MAG TPA: hypothetical protein VJ385_20855 [Fibrobacteria bacterium]|nr:hypothetical protein [Fibrobacteria bacterium]